MIKFRYNKNLNNKSLDRIKFLMKNIIHHKEWQIQWND